MLEALELRFLPDLRDFDLKAATDLGSSVLRLNKLQIVREDQSSIRILSNADLIDSRLFSPFETKQTVGTSNTFLIHIDSRDLLPDVAASFALFNNKVSTEFIFGTSSLGIYCAEEPRKSSRWRSSNRQALRGKSKSDVSREKEVGCNSEASGKWGEGDWLDTFGSAPISPEIFCDNSQRQLLKLDTSETRPLSLSSFLPIESKGK